MAGHLAVTPLKGNSDKGTLRDRIGGKGKKGKRGKGEIAP
jgi:hypothetical protein